jgi:hypothetical protein
MALRSFIVLSWAAILYVVSQGVSVHARSCAVQEPIEAEYRRSAAVFTGRVTSLRIVRGPKGEFDVETVATFEVQQWWKGRPTKFVEVRSCGGDDVVCTVGFQFDVGVSYVVFAQRHPLQTSNCLRTQIVDEAADVLKWLETLKAK